MIGPTRLRTARLLVVALVALLVAALVAIAAGSVSLRAASAQSRALMMAAGVLCAPGETGAPAHPAGHGHPGDCCCLIVGHFDTPPAPAAPKPADPAAIARFDPAGAAAPGHPAGKEFVKARGPPSLV